MQPKHYSRFHASMQKLAASAPGSWFLARALRDLDRLTLQLTRGRRTLSSILTGVPVVWVTTTGARSGRPRTRPLLPVHDPQQPGTFALIASNFGQHHFPAWYYNLKKNPRANCMIGKETATYAAHEAAGEEYERFWRLANEAYFGYEFYKQR